MGIFKHIIIIDDDPFNNKICTITLEKVYKDAKITSFLNPVAGFEYLVSEYGKKESDAGVMLFLDINMPVMNGWEFLERFEELDSATKGKVKIYILSSSVDKRDMEKARLNKNVLRYLVKPLTRETVSDLA